jgi:methyl-accepting chemotaxis protein
VGKLASRLRIGEKIGLSFGVVGLLFLGVIWQYDATLKTVLANYERLQQVFEARKTSAFSIENHLGETRQAESNFLLHREEHYAEAVDHNARALLDETGRLAEIDEVSRLTAQEIRTQVEVYLDRFNAIADAWRVKGLDENSGLQGAFRDRVHELEARAGNFQTDRLLLNLLQIRRGEKDLGLRRESQYRDKVRGLLNQLSALVGASDLYPQVKEALLEEIQVYSSAFDDYAEEVLSGRDIHGGKGPFRDSAHRLEAILDANYVPDLETDVLQLRRREKDYLLRGDHLYVRMTGEIAERIRTNIDDSAIPDADKTMLTGLLAAYERDFLALVAQNDQIAELDDAMREAAAQITPLVRKNVEEANRRVAEESAQVAETANRHARLNLVIVACALALGIFFSFAITSRIVRPVREMAGLLDRLTHESPPERIPTVTGARDEINAMAESLNTLADHRATFVAWWKTSMNEALALRDLHEAPTEGLRTEATEELRRAALAKVQQLNNVRGQLRKHAARISEIAGRVKPAGPTVLARDEATELEHAAEGVQTLLSVTEDAR